MTTGRFLAAAAMIAAAVSIYGCGESDEQKKERMAKELVMAAEAIDAAADMIAQKETFGAMKAEIGSYRMLMSACEEETKKKCTFKYAGYAPADTRLYMAYEGKNGQLFISTISADFGACSGMEFTATLDGLTFESEKKEKVPECAKLLEKYGLK